jgi:hypothetical protein
VSLPPGLLDALRADTNGVRSSELTRVRRALEVRSPDEPEVVSGIVEGLLAAGRIGSASHVATW